MWGEHFLLPGIVSFCILPYTTNIICQNERTNQRNDAVRVFTDSGHACRPHKDDAYSNGAAPRAGGDSRFINAAAPISLIKRARHSACSAFWAHTACRNAHAAFFASRGRQAHRGGGQQEGFKKGNRTQHNQAPAPWSFGTRHDNTSRRGGLSCHRAAAGSGIDGAATMR